MDALRGGLEEATTVDPVPPLTIDREEEHTCQDGGVMRTTVEEEDTVLNEGGSLLLVETTREEEHADKGGGLLQYVRTTRDEEDTYQGGGEELLHVTTNVEEERACQAAVLSECTNREEEHSHLDEGEGNEFCFIEKEESDEDEQSFWLLAAQQLCAGVADGEAGGRGAKCDGQLVQEQRQGPVCGRCSYDNGDELGQKLSGNGCDCEGGREEGKEQVLGVHYGGADVCQKQESSESGGKDGGDGGISQDSIGRQRDDDEEWSLEECSTSDAAGRCNASEGVGRCSANDGVGRCSWDENELQDRTDLIFEELLRHRTQC